MMRANIAPTIVAVFSLGLHTPVFCPAVAYSNAFEFKAPAAARPSVRHA